MLLNSIDLELKDLEQVKIEPQKFDKTKETIVIVDDNEGICAFLKDDLSDITDKNILTFSGIHAVFKCIKFCETYNITPEYCILDIIFNGIITKDKTNLKLNGIHLLEYFLNKKNIHYCFFTGSLSSNIHDFDNQYNKLTKKDIQEKVIPKLVLNYKDRTRKIQELLEL